MQATSKISFLDSLGLWARIGLVSFGGPAAQISLMHRELVEKRRWISDGRFLHALNYCMVLPGPEAQQLATYMGWLTHGPLGGICAGLLFILPSLAIMISAGSLYVLYGALPEVQAVLYGIKPAVLAIVIAACFRLADRVLRGPLWWAIATGSLLGLLVGLSFVAIILTAAFVGWVAHLLSRSTLKGLEAYVRSEDKDKKNAKPHGHFVIDDHSPPPEHSKTESWHLASAIGIGVAIWALLYSALSQYAPIVLTEMSAFFTKVALVTFGGAYAVLPYVFDSAVNDYQWVTAAQMMDALALGETTPGPLVMVNAFVGFVGAAQHTSLAFLPITTAGILGALVVTLFTFLPSFVFILAGAPWVEATRKNLSLAAPLTAISSAVVGVIVDLAFIFAGHTFWADGDAWSWRSIDLVAIFIAVLAGIMLIQFRLGMLFTLGVSMALGAVAVAMGLP